MNDIESSDSSLPEHLGFKHAAEKVKTFPPTPGVYLMKDASGVVIYIGKAKKLFPSSRRSRIADRRMDSRDRRY
jgi:excinuclease UvrABC nuclease subunit